MALTKVGSSPGAVSLPSDDLVLAFTADSGTFQYGDQLCYIYSTVAVPITGMNASVFYAVHSVDASEDGQSLILVTVPSAPLTIGAPGVALRGATATSSTHHSVGSPGTNGDGNDTVKTASGGSGRTATLPGHASGAVDDATHDIFTYVAVFVGGPLAGAFSSPHVGALSAGTDLGEVTGTADSSGGMAAYPAAARASYNLAAPALEVGVSGVATWTGAGSTRAWIARMTDAFRLEQGGPTAVLAVTGGTPSYDVHANITGSTDPDEGNNDAIDWDVDWGDGTAHATGRKGVSSGANHTYATYDTYTVVLTTDDLYGHTDTDTADVEAGPIPEAFGLALEIRARRVNAHALPHSITSLMFENSENG